MTLLRLLELQSGNIEIDGIDIKYVSLDLLRQRCFIAVSQDPLILPNETLRFNLDPNCSVAEDTLIAALTRMGLWAHFSSPIKEERAAAVYALESDDHPILDQRVSLFQDLSVGQRQLFALCRALVKTYSLRRLGLKPVIVLDEITSSVDTVTESSIHQIIDHEFTNQGHTVIVVAHRIGALQVYLGNGRDAVAIMAGGRLQEVITDLGPAMFQYLSQMA